MQVLCLKDIILHWKMYLVNNVNSGASLSYGRKNKEKAKKRYVAINVI